MTRATFRAFLDPPWTSIEPLRLGCVPKGLGAADRFVTVESGQGPLLRVDLYKDTDECFTFEDVRLWSSFVVIGWGHRIYLVTPHPRKVSAFDLGSYFGHMYEAENYLLVASAEHLFCIERDGSLGWQSTSLGVDGVIVDRVEGDVVQGQGELDPPGGWRPFSVSLRSGQILK